jgi:hypothetical protein
MKVVASEGADVGNLSRIGAAVLVLALGGCSGRDLGIFFRSTAAGLAEGACRAAANCSTGMRSDPLAPKPAWQTGGAPPKDTPYRLPAPR